MTSEQDIDAAVLRELDSYGEEGLARRLVAIFAEQAPASVAGMRRALSEGDRDSLERLAHRLKSTAGHVGALGVHAIARDLERIAKSESLDGAGAELEGLARAVEHAAPALERALDAGGAEPT